MPSYEYQCPDCEFSHEFIHSMSKSPKVICPNCDKPMDKLISPGSKPVFKGSGFYETDYKNK